MRGEPFRGVLAKPERRSAVQKREQRQHTLSRSQCRQIVYRRERMRCQRCGLHLDFDLYPPDPRVPHVNEIVPKSQGGDPCDPANCELCCGNCHLPNGEHAPTKARMDRLLALAEKAKRLKREARS